MKSFSPLLLAVAFFGSVPLSLEAAGPVVTWRDDQPLELPVAALAGRRPAS